MLIFLYTYRLSQKTKTKIILWKQFNPDDTGEPEWEVVGEGSGLV